MLKKILASAGVLALSATAMAQDTTTDGGLGGLLDGLLGGSLGGIGIGALLLVGVVIWWFFFRGGDDE